MPTIDIVRWLRGEHDELQDYADRLRERIAKAPPGDRRRWIEDLINRFDGFADYFLQRIAREEDNGYLRPIVDARPSMSEPVTLLRHEHEELRRLIERVRQAVHRLPPDARFLLRDACKRIQDLLCWIDRHEEHENCVVICAIGVEGKLPQQAGAGQPSPAQGR